MICQNCGKRTATTHIKTIVNGKLTQYHLCDDCAREKGYGNFFSGWSLNFGDMLGGLIDRGGREKTVTRCEKCGCSFEEIARSGKIGCPQCYQTFRRQLMPVIQRIHGTTRHKGKRPGSSALRVVEKHSEIMPVKKTPLEEKKQQLQEAIEAQEFERAAILRDEIKEMESHG